MFSLRPVRLSASSALHRLVQGSALMFFFLLSVWVCPSSAADGPTLVYRRVFKSSSPEFIEIKMSEKGECTFDIRQLDNEADPQPFQVNPALAEKMFQMAAELNHFRDLQLDVKRRIANLGEKTFRYENAGQASEATFNYTVNPTAQQLMQVFEGLARQQEHIRLLQHRIRFDRLGVNDALRRFEIDLNQKLLPEPERALPALEAVANDSRIVEIARTRARALIERIRNSR